MVENTLSLEMRQKHKFFTITNDDVTSLFPAEFLDHNLGTGVPRGVRLACHR